MALWIGEGAMVKRTAFALLACMFLTGLQYNASHETVYGQWKTFLMSLGTDRYSRALTTNGVIYFVITLPAGRCDSPLISLMGEFPKRIDRDIDIRGFKARLRVDRKIIHNSNMSIYSERGDNAWSRNMDDLDKPLALLAELKTGSVLRIETTINGKNEYHRFSLYGSKEAINRLSDLCRQPFVTGIEYTEPDANYFPDTEKPATGAGFQQDRPAVNEQPAVLEFPDDLIFPD